MNLPTDAETVLCPYDSSHRLHRKRLQQHLLKCKRNHPEIELKVCPFNKTHLLKEADFGDHVKNCSDRKIVSQYKFDAPTIESDECLELKPVECDENWDDDLVVDYNPRQYAKNAPVLRKPTGLQPAKRKDFVKKEHERLSKFYKDEPHDRDEERDDRDEKRFKSNMPVTNTSVAQNTSGILRRPKTPPPPNWNECINELKKREESDAARSSQFEDARKWNPQNSRNNVNDTNVDQKMRTPKIEPKVEIRVWEDYE